MTYLANLEVQTDDQTVAFLLENAHSIKPEKRAPGVFIYPEGLTLEDLQNILEKVYSDAMPRLSSFEERPLGFVLHIAVTIWEKEKKSWEDYPGKPKPLKGFPNFHLRSVTFTSESSPYFLEVRQSLHVTDKNKKSGGEPHRAILVVQKPYRYITDNHNKQMWALIRDPSMIRQAFDCFEALT